MSTSNIAVDDAADVEVENYKFAFSPSQLSRLINPKSLSAFHALGGLHGLEKGLRTDIRHGLRHDESYLDGTVRFGDITASTLDNELMGGSPRPNHHANTGNQVGRPFGDRKRVFGNNALPTPKGRDPWEVIRSLSMELTAASLGLAFMRLLAASVCQNNVDWIAPASIMAAVLIVATITSLYNSHQEIKAAKSKWRRNYRMAKVIRSGKTMEIPVYDILVGDVVHLEPGDCIPVDGILIGGHGLKCDESSSTGESDAIRKYAADEVSCAIDSQKTLSKMDPFLVSGSKVLEGVGTFLVTATGARSTYGQILVALEHDLQEHRMELRSPTLVSFVIWHSLSAIPLLVGAGNLNGTAWAHDHAQVSNILTSCLFVAAMAWLGNVIRIAETYLGPLAQELMANAREPHRILELNTPTSKYSFMRLIGTLRSFFLRLDLSLPRLPFQHHSRGSATLPVMINGLKVHAIPDTGADENVISTACVSKLGLTIERDPDPATFKLANGRCVVSCGLVRTSLTFARGKGKSKIQVICKVFPTLAVPLIMGRKFLRDTKTLTKHDDRLQRSFNPLGGGVPRIFHLNAAKQRLRCYLDGIPVYANADTGAEMNLASPKWAARSQVAIRKPDRGYERVMLADGSIARISGQFSARFHVFRKGPKGSAQKAYTREFFILEGLTSDVLLCQDLLLETRAFKEQRNAFIELSDADSFSDLNLVSWLSRRERRFLTFFKRDPPGKPEKGPPEPPRVSFQEQMDMEAAREQHRHTEAVREISKLAEPERQGRIAHETQRHEAVLRSHAARVQAHHALRLAMQQNLGPRRPSPPRVGLFATPRGRIGSD